MNPKSEPRAIELKLRDTSQLFNSMDPSPFHEKDLDHDAEEFIVSWAQEHSLRDPLILRIHLDRCPDGKDTDVIQQAIHNYFHYRVEMARRELRNLMKQARTSLFTGGLFLALCLTAGSVVAGRMPEVWGNFFREGLTIIGWVAMWRPVQLYLYDWVPVSRQIAILKKLSRIPVEITDQPAAGVSVA